jgi:hypothetical protein
MSAYTDATNRLAKWRSVLAGWQLGTRIKEDPEAEAVRDHREVTLLLRTEVNALTKLLIDKGVFTTEEFENTIIAEAEWMHAMLEQRFPGMKAESWGIGMKLPEAAETMKNWKP